jgi:cell wall integrity and stress response component
MFQTNGLCHDFCVPQGYAYAVTQTNNCWCSNFTPEKSYQVSSSKCSFSCPGYPDEKCGGDGLFGYVVLNGALPSGTKGPGSTSTTDVSFPVYFHCLARFAFLFLFSPARPYC